MAGRHENPVADWYPELTQLCEDLRQLRLQAGHPTLDEMALECHVSKSRLSVATAGKVTPTWMVVQAWLDVCSCTDLQHWKERHAKVEAAVRTARLRRRPEEPPDEPPAGLPNEPPDGGPGASPSGAPVDRPPRQAGTPPGGLQWHC